MQDGSVAALPCQPYFDPSPCFVEPDAVPQVIAYLQQREDDLMFQVNNLQQQLDATMSRTMEVRETVHAPLVVG
jgi:hypothetical protein